MRRVTRILSPAGVLTAFCVFILTVGVVGGLACVYALFQIGILLDPASASWAELFQSGSGLALASVVVFAAYRLIDHSITAFDNWEVRRARGSVRSKSHVSA